MTETVELHGAFAWDCDACGAANFHRSQQGCLDDEQLHEVMDALDGDGDFGAIELMADKPFVEEPDSDEWMAVSLITRIVIVPGRVRCSSCGAVFKTTVPTAGESGDEEN